MAYHQRPFTVMRGGVAGEQLKARPVRITPQGFAGVVFGGRVHTLHEGDMIDLDSTSWSKAACPRFVITKHPIPYAPALDAASGGEALIAPDDWYVETNKFGHYVLFDADEDIAERVVDALDDHLGVRRWDVSHRPADDGYQYDWFVRLDPWDVDNAAVVSEVRKVIEAPDEETAGHGADGVDSTDDVSAELENIQQRLAHLIQAQELAAAQGERDEALACVATLEKRLALESRQHQQALAAAVEQRIEATRHHEALVRDLREQHRADLRAVEQAHARTLEEFRTSDADGADTHEVAALRERLLAAESDASDNKLLAQGYADDLDQAKAAVARLEDNLLQLHVEIVDLKEAATERDDLREQVDDLKGRLREEADEPEEAALLAKPRRPRSPHRASVANFVARLLPRTDFDDDCLDNLLEFADPVEVFDRLHEIDRRYTRSSKKPVALTGFDGALKISKIQTGVKGRESMGRVYYRPENDRVTVHLHIKQDNVSQSRFLKSHFGS